ncbi:MAG: ABC transporter ATP-binding protein/permease [Acidobacteriota bacterium]|nr:ABC transporter ATP-binding protein/permease [Acidobacteriota bacterium]
MHLLFGYLRGYWRLVAVALTLATINQTFSLLDPLILRHVIDTYATRFQDYTTGEFFRGVSLLLGAAVGVAFVSRVAKNFQDYYINVITQRLGAQLYSDGIQHSLQLPYSVFEDQRSGETLGRLQKVRTDVERLIATSINVLFTSLVGIVFVMIYAYSVHWLIAPVYFLTVPILGIISSVLSRRIKHIQKVIVAETTALAGSTTESLRNIELVKSLGLGPQEIERLNATTNKILVLELKKVKYLRSLSFIQGTAVNLLRTGIMFLMLYLIFTRAITVGQFFSLFIYSFFIFGPLQELGNVINIYRETEASLNVYQDILRIPTEPRPVNPVPLKHLTSLAFEHVTFRHQSASSPAVSDISFTAHRGETIALVGPSGAGKTTLVKLLVGLYQPQSGRVLYNGTAGTEVDLDGLRERIGFVTQDTQLFSGTIRENLLFVNPGASDAECLDALRKAACDNLLARADRGLDTVIGEGGVKVSGGEKQRLSIARALLRRPHLLVFDEATSSLDSITEEGIVDTIRNVTSTADTITVLIAHRLSTILHADRIYVLERGQIVETGRHQELVERMGLYYAMWRQQIGERRAVYGAGSPGGAPAGTIRSSAMSPT